jgi:hypothetical protein
MHINAAMQGGPTPESKVFLNGTYGFKAGIIMGLLLDHTLVPEQ